MTENPVMENGTSSEKVSTSSEGHTNEHEEKSASASGPVSVSEQINRLQYTSIKSDSFAVDMEHLSHVTKKDMTVNSRTARSLSRKGCQRSSEKKTNSNLCNEKDTNFVPNTSQKATLSGASMPEKTIGTIDENGKQQTHHQITIMTGKMSTTAPTAAATESKLSSRRFSFRRPSPSRLIDPRRILLFFATLSSMGTMWLIYFTLTMRKHSGDDI